MILLIFIYRRKSDLISIGIDRSSICFVFQVVFQLPIGYFSFVCFLYFGYFKGKFLINEKFMCDLYKVMIIYSSIVVTMPRRSHGNIGRRSNNATRHRNIAARRTEDERVTERESARIRMVENRVRQSQELCPVNFECAAFRYDPNIQYSAHASVQIGQMSVVCHHCNAVKFEKEPPGLCCADGKVKLPELLPPPEPLRTLLYGESPNSKHFLQHIKMYNDCFQMTSFGSEIVNVRNYNPTFKVISTKTLYIIIYNVHVYIII